MAPWLLLILALVPGPAGLGVQALEFPASFSTSTWTTVDGLPQNSVTGVSLDSAGYLWLGTFGGLARFDGERFEVLSVSNRGDLAGNRFDMIFGDSHGDLWGAVQNVGLLRYRDDQFELIESDSIVRSVIEDPSGAIWTRSDRGLGRVHENKVTHIRDGNLITLLATRDGAIWRATSDGTLIRLDGERETAFGVQDGLSSESIACLLQDENGLLWAANRRGAWRSTDATHARFEKVESAPTEVRSMIQGEAGHIWFVCADGVQRWNPDPTKSTPQIPGAYASIIRDRRGNIWLGSTTGKGLACIRPSALHQPKGIPRADTWTVTAGTGGAVLVVQNHDLIELRGEIATVTSFPEHARTAHVDRHGDLWVGQMGGVIRLSGEERSEYSDPPELRGGVRVLFESRDGSLWVGTDQGLSRRVGEQFNAVFPGELKALLCMHQDNQSDAFWIGTQEGLAHIVGDRLEWITREQGLAPGGVRALHQDPEGVLWVGTYGGGLSRLKHGAITRISEEHGLADNFISSILEDDQGRFWINSNRGPFVVQRSDLNSLANGALNRIACVLFTAEEGALEASGGYQSSSWKDPEGRMWFSTIDGVTVADPRELPVLEPAPQVHLEEMALGADRALYVRYTALGFSAPERVRSQYRLVGHDPKWIEHTGPREVRYTYLRPSEYEFQVRARNGFGPWSEIVSAPLSVSAAFHETTGFLVAIIVLLGAAAFGLAEFRTRSSRARADELEVLHSQREQAKRELSRSQATLSRLARAMLVTQESERRLISSELHDDVTQRVAALAIHLEVVLARSESVAGTDKGQLQSIVEAAQQLAGDVQQLSRRLHPVGLRTLGLSEAVRQECDAFTRRSQIEVQLSDQLASEGIQEDVSVAIFRILQESLHNIEKHAQASCVEVELERQDNNLLLNVRDDGRGFEAGGERETGLGLVTMQERAAGQGGQLRLTSKPGMGTLVQLVVPGRTNPQ